MSRITQRAEKRLTAAASHHPSRRRRQKIHKLSEGSFTLNVLKKRRRIDQALYALQMEGHLQWISTRKVDLLFSGSERSRGSPSPRSRDLRAARSGGEHPSHRRLILPGPSPSSLQRHVREGQRRRTRSQLSRHRHYLHRRGRRKRGARNRHWRLPKWPVTPSPSKACVNPVCIACSLLSVTRT